MEIDERRLRLKEPLASDPEAFELLTSWWQSGRVSVMSATGTGLEQSPAVWGDILAAIGGNIALSMRNATGADPMATLATIKEALDRSWAKGAQDVGKHYPY